MFERFTKEARTSVVGAQQVARDTASRHVDTAHLLVVLLEQEGPTARTLDALGVDRDELASRARADLRAGGLDADALAGLGIDLDAVRRQADAVFGPGALERAGRKRSGHIPFTADAKKALELSLREAIRLKQSNIRSSHLLLGILRADCPGRVYLQRNGVDVDDLRAALDEQARAA
jgi:ATP-dependent Clp protease ATP-binding subunit ClpA